MAFVEYFHFLRPLLLIALPGIVVFWWLLRPKHAKNATQHLHIAPHLADAMRVGDTDRRRFAPVDGPALVAVLLTLAAAGPTWTRAPNPLVADTAPLVIALEVTPSMQATDLAPTRADRARFKILDLVEQRAGARTALVGYAGSAHRVAPLTEDPGILRPLVESLTPEAMPLDGDAPDKALIIAQDILAQAETPGAVLFVLDDLNPSLVPAFNTAEVPVLFLVVAPEGTKLTQLNKINGAEVIYMTPDNRDIARIERRVRAEYRAALAEDDRLQWQDRGWWLAWPAAVLALLWFRRGWSLYAALCLAVMQPVQARAESTLRAEVPVTDPTLVDHIADWFLTPDQQGQIALNRKKPAKAAQAFQDPYLKGYALYKSGQYDLAAAHMAGLDSAQAAFVEGMSRIKIREYRPAISAFETALERQPDYPQAEHNLMVAKVILEEVESTREQSDTGEHTGLGADDVVFDNEDARGAVSQIEAPQEDEAPLTADQWISSIDTDMTKFLRSRFLYDNAQEAAQ